MSKYEVLFLPWLQRYVVVKEPNTEYVIPLRHLNDWPQIALHSIKRASSIFVRQNGKIKKDLYGLSMQM